MSVRHLLWRSVPVTCLDCRITVTDLSKKARLMKMLEIIKLFPSLLPDGTPASDSHAITWLLERSEILEQLVQLAGMVTMPVDAAEMLR
jgi:hypothetical protein